MSKKNRGRKGKKVSRKAVESRTARMLEGMNAYYVRNHLVRKNHHK